jgi:drug/metabolite transporter (DMT)-like permease
MTRATADLLLLLAALIWGLAFVWQQTAMAHLGPLTFTGTRFLIAAAAVLPFVLRERTRGPAIPRARFGALLGIGAVFFLTVGVQQFGLLRTTVTNAGFLTALYVVMVPAIAVAATRRRVHPAVWPAAALSLAGMALLGGGGIAGLNWGDGLIIVSAFFGALQIVGLSLLVGNLGRPLAVAFAQYAVTGVIGLGLAFMFETPSLAGLMGAWREIAYTGLLSGGVAFTLQSIAQAHTPPSDAAIIVSMESVFAALFGALILGERLNLSGWIGAGLVMAAVLVVQLVPIYGRRWLRRPPPGAA